MIRSICSAAVWVQLGDGRACVTSFYGCWIPLMDAGPVPARRRTGPHRDGQIQTAPHSRRARIVQRNPTGLARVQPCGLAKYIPCLEGGRRKDESKSASVNEGGQILGEKCVVRNHPFPLYSTRGKCIVWGGGGLNSSDASMIPMLPAQKTSIASSPGTAKTSHGGGLDSRDGSAGIIVSSTGTLSSCT
jgi:hypothetical protein